MRNDPEHLDLVRQLSCVVCRNERLGDTPAVAHHIKKAGHSGVAYKADDDKTIPLCNIHHNGSKDGKKAGQVGYHESPKEFEERYGTQLELLEQTRSEVEQLKGMYVC